MTEFQDPAAPEVDTTPRRAKLDIRQRQADSPSNLKYLRLIASNGEPLMHGEFLSNAKKGREAIIVAMIEVLSDEGYSVLPPGKLEDVIGAVAEVTRMDEEGGAPPVDSEGVLGKPVHPDDYYPGRGGW